MNEWREKRKSFLKIESQPIHTESIMELESHHMPIITDIINSCKKQQWVSKLVGKSEWRMRFCIVSKCLHRKYLLIMGRKVTMQQWQADTTVFIKRSKLTPPVTGQTPHALQEDAVTRTQHPWYLSIHGILARNSYWSLSLRKHQKTQLKGHPTKRQVYNLQKCQGHGKTEDLFQNKGTRKHDWVQHVSLD